MNKKLLTLAVATVMAAPLAVQAAGTGPTVYGKAQVAVEHVDDEAQGAAAGTDDSSWRTNSRQSLFGIKGSEDLGNGLSAIYKMEFQVDMDNHDDASGLGLQDATMTAESGLIQRNQYVGLSHKDYGTLTLGRQDDPIKMYTIGRDPFNTKLGDWNEVNGNSGVDNMEHAGANRQNDAILYQTPNFSGFEVAAMIAPGESNDDDMDGISDGLASIAARYSNGPIYIAAGWEEDENANTGAGFDDEEQWRVVASYDIAGFRLSGMYTEVDNVAGADDADAETWQLGVIYTLGNNKLKAMWQEGEQDDSCVNGAAVVDCEYEAFALGAEHHFSKRTHVFAIYMETEDDTSGASNNDIDAFSMGIAHKF